MSMLNSNIPGYKYQGEFEIDGYMFSGLLVADSDNGVITLIISKRFTDSEAIEYTPKNYGRLSLIHGFLEKGKKVTLFKCRCISSNYKEFSPASKYHSLRFNIEYMVMAHIKDEKTAYSKFQFVIENGVSWAGISQILVLENKNGAPPNQVRFRGNEYFKKYFLSGSLIMLRSSLHNFQLMSQNRAESFNIEERLQITISPPVAADISYFLSLRDQIIDMISFAVKGNVNIKSQSLIPDSPNQMLDHLVVSNTKHQPIYPRDPSEYNFIFEQLPKTKDASKALQRLEPIFKLYASFYRYRDMPLEMLFLNVVQALETLHNRFYVDTSQQSLIPLSFQENIVSTPRITLSSRMTDLISRADLFARFSHEESPFIDRVVLARNYYTHYTENQRHNALDRECLYDVIQILKCLLEYHVCVQLGIDISDRINKELDLICTGADGLPKNIFDI